MTAAPTAESSKIRKSVAKPRPAIAGTKASQARAKAIKSAQLSSSQPSAPKKRKTTLEEPNSQAKLYHTKASGLKQRPAWDLRGKVEDMTNLYKMNVQRLDELREFKRELEITKCEKESQEKEAIQKAAALRTELVNLERQHTVDIADLHAKHRIEYQKLEDDSLNYYRRLNTMDIEVSDARTRLNVAVQQLDQIKQENQSLRENIEKTSVSYEQAEHEMRQLYMKVKKLNMSIEDREKDIQKKKMEIEVVDSSVQEWEAKLAESCSTNARLLNIVKELEDSANNKRAVTKLST